MAVFLLLKPAEPGETHPSEESGWTCAAAIGPPVWVSGLRVRLGFCLNVKPPPCGRPGFLLVFSQTSHPSIQGDEKDRLCAQTSALQKQG